MKLRLWHIGLLFAINAILTIATAGVVGPAPQKLANIFGLVAWAGRTPFYLLPLYLTPVTLLFRPSLAIGVVSGIALALPLALWAKAAHCPVSVQLTYIISGILQGAILSYLMRKWSNQSLQPTTGRRDQ